MSYDIGDRRTADLTLKKKDANGVLQLTNGTVVLTVTKPDGTAVSPAPTVVNDSTGIYHADYDLDAAGTWLERWTSTGAVVAAQSAQVRVRDASSRLVSLEDVKAHLFGPTTDTTHDEKLLDAIEAATSVIEDGDGNRWPGTGPVVARTVVERVAPTGKKMILGTYPVISLTTIAAAVTGGSTYTVGDLTVDGASGIVRYLSGQEFSGYEVNVTYVAGRVPMPAAIRQAALEWVRVFWQKTQGGLPASAGFDDVDAAPSLSEFYRLAGAYRRGPSVA